MAAVQAQMTSRTHTAHARETRAARTGSAPCRRPRHCEILPQRRRATGVRESGHAPPIVSIPSMNFGKTLSLIAVLVCAGCPADDDDDTGAETGSTSNTTTTTASTTDTTTASTTLGTSDATESSGPGSSSESEGSSDHGHDTSAGHDTSGDHGTSGHDSGSETGQTVCDMLGEGCHDNETKEGQMCHLVGHDGDEAACEKIFDMCAKICGL